MATFGEVMDVIAAHWDDLTKKEQDIIAAAIAGENKA